MSIYRGPGGAGDATNDASSEASLVAQKVTEATEAAEQASASAVAASASASSASTYADAASSSASAAATSASNASTSASSASSSASTATTQATNAASSASAASTSASNASSSASTATTKASEASTSASNASTSATAAETSATAAANSASSASTSASSASTSATSAAASLDSFDDRYLGPKSSNPSVDNDGNTLLTGAIYWNTTSNEFRVWSGSTWVLFSGIPSQSDNSGKFLGTNGSVVSWDELPVASSTSDGIVFGYTDESGTKQSAINYWMTLNDGTNVEYYQGFDSLSSDASRAVNYDTSVAPVVGDHVYIRQINPYTSAYIRTIDLGVITSIHTAANINKVGFRTTNVFNLAPYVYGSDGTVAGLLYRQSDTGSLGGNTSLGKGSNDSGTNNTTVGFEAGSTITTGSNLIVIGKGAEPTSATATNEATIGNSSTTKTRIWGSLAINDQTGTSGQVLTSNGSSTPTWQTPAAAPVTSVNSYTGVVSLTYSDVGAASSAQGTKADTAYGWGNHASAGYAADSAVVHKTGDETIAGTKTFSSTISGSINGNAATVTNGLYTTSTINGGTF